MVPIKAYNKDRLPREHEGEVARVREPGGRNESLSSLLLLILLFIIITTMSSSSSSSTVIMIITIIIIHMNTPRTNFG